MDEQPNKIDKKYYSRALVALAFSPLLLAVVSSPRVHSAKPVQGERTVPSLVFSQYSVNLREIPATGRVAVPYSFWNRSKKDLIIEGLDPSCGCLAPKLLGDRKHYQPGGQGGFEIHLDMAKESPGPKSYQVLVRYNDGEPQSELVTFRVTVPEKTVQVTPSELYFYQTTDHELKSEVQVKDRRGRNLNVVEVRSKSQFLATEIRDKHIDGETSTTPIVVSVTGLLPSGSSTTTLSIKTDDPDFPVIQIPVFLQGKPRAAQFTAGESTTLLDGQKAGPAQLIKQ